MDALVPPTNGDTLAPPAPKLLIQIVETAPGHLEVHSPLPGAAVVEIFIKLLPNAWDQAKQQIQAKQPKIIAPSGGFMRHLRRFNVGGK